jgi:DNA-binding transcriptional MerR regulator
VGENGYRYYAQEALLRLQQILFYRELDIPLDDIKKIMPKGAGSPEVQGIVERWRKHMDYFWTPQLEQLLDLVNGYNDDPRFKDNLKKMHPQLAVFMREAVKIYVANGKK